MVSTQATTGIWEILLWIFAGSGLLGLPPGERDLSLIKAVPPQTIAYFEWSARGDGQVGATGIDGFVADPEIRQLFDDLGAALLQAQHGHGEDSSQETGAQGAVLPRLLKLITSHPGCLFVGFEPPPPNNSNLPTLLRMLSGAHAGIVLSSGPDTDLLWQNLIDTLQTLPDFQFDPNSSTQSIPISVPGYSLVMHREGSRVLFALGDSTLQRLLDGLAGRLPGLDSNTRFQQSLNRIAVPQVSTIGWLDGQGLLNSILTTLGPVGALMRPLLNMAGADAIDHVIHSSGVEQGEMVQRTFVATGGRTDGIMVLLAGQPIEPKHFSHVPADADLVLGFSLSLSRVFQESRQLLSRIQPLSVRVFDEAVKQLETELELKIVDDVLPAFGDTFVAFDSPSAGGMIASSLIVSLEVIDSQKATIVFDRLMKLVEQSLVSDQTEFDYGATVSLREQSFLGHRVFFVNTSGGGYRGHVSITPTFCLLDRHLLFAVHPQAMKAHLRYLQSNQPGFDQSAGQKVNVPSGDVLKYAYLDGPRANSTMATVLPYLAHVLLARLEAEGIFLDAFSIPSAAAITPYFGDSTALVTRHNDGLMIESKNAPPVLIGLALLSEYRSWNAHEFEYLDVLRRRAPQAGQAQLGEIEAGVIPAVAETKEASKGPTESSPSTFKKIAPLFLKALIPEGYQQMIPESTLRKLEEGPPPEVLQRREEARRLREERRQRRLRPAR